MRVCAIHQPNFFPWLGYFDKIQRADVFVFLDRVQYPKSGSSMSSWCNRVRINVNGAPSWIACPVIRERGVQLIDTVRINNTRCWQDDIRKTLEAGYRKAPGFSAAFTVVDSLLRYETDSLADFNVNAVRTLADYLDCHTEWLRQSALPPMTDTSTERLVAICRSVQADAYLCGGGSSDYLEEAAFERGGLRLRYQNYVEPVDGPSDRFLPGLSVIDRLMHAPGGVRNWR